MSCLAVFRERIGGILASAARVGRMAIDFNRIGGIDIDFSRIGGLHASAERATRMRCRMGLVCNTSVGVGFLYASDELLITLEDGKLIVKRKN